MSPSSIRRLWPAERRVGLALGHEGVCAAELVRARDGWQIAALSNVPLTAGLFHGRPTLAQEADLALCLRQLSAAWRGRYRRLHVAVPDTLGWLAHWELEALPRRPALRQALARWRLASELRLEENTLECAIQSLGIDHGKHRLLAQGMDRDWLDCLRRALRTAGLVPWSLNQAFAYRYNHFHAQLTGAGRGAALVSLDPTAWSLLAWDGQGRPCHLRAARRSPLDRAAPEWEALAEEIERSVLGYVHAAEGREVDQLYLSGGDARLAEFGAALDRRLACACTLLRPALAATAVPAADETNADLALTAAVAV